MTTKFRPNRHSTPRGPEMLRKRLAVSSAMRSSADLACRLFGRDNVAHIAQSVLMRARLDGRNDMKSNGELRLQDWILEIAPVDAKIHVLDVGANVGNWSLAMISAARRAGRLSDLSLDAFEPAPDSFAELRSNLNGDPASLHELAIGDVNGPAYLHLVGPTAGRNSFYHASDSVSKVVVSMVTLAAFVQERAIDHVMLMKIDAEGHDFAVIRGAESLFAARKVSAIQFEYSCRWIDSRAFLRDVFDILGPRGYSIGKLTPNGVQFYVAWSPALETFTEGNYVACLPQVARRLPMVG